MSKEGELERHEFWIKKYPDEYQDPETTGFYRVALGELIDASQRQTYGPPEGSHSPDFWNKSGSIGFMDVTVRKEFVPKVDAKPYSEDRHDYLMRDCEEKEVLVIATVGIEPEHRGKGFARLLKQRAEEIASEWGLDTIVADMIENPIMRE